MSTEFKIRQTHQRKKKITSHRKMNERDILRKQKRFTSYANFMQKLYTHFHREIVIEFCAPYIRPN